jgi:hypothetical protein
MSGLHGRRAAEADGNGTDLAVHHARVRRIAQHSQAEQVAIHDRPQRLNDVEDEGVAALEVAVEDAPPQMGAQR